MEDKSVTTIKPVSGWFNFDIKGIFKRKDLIFLLVRRNFVSSYKQTILGPVWAIIQPLLTTFVFSFVFGRLAGLSTDGAPDFLFYLSGNIAWSYFAYCLNSTSVTFVSNSNLLGKVYFPRLIMPITTVMTGLISFGIQSVMFAIATAFFLIFTEAQVIISFWILFVPVLIVMMAMLGLGLGIIVSAVTTKYRDLFMLISFGVQLWLYATPVAYGTTIIPDKLMKYYMLNPMSPIISMIRYSVIGSLSDNLTVGMLLEYLGIAAITITVILSLGVILFSRVEKTFMDTV